MTFAKRNGVTGGWGRRLRSSLLGGLLPMLAGAAVAAVPGDEDTSFYTELASMSTYYFEGGHAVVALPNGNLVVGGTFNVAVPKPWLSAVTRNNMAMYTKAGDLVMGFDPNVDGPVYQIVVQPDGKMLIQGGFSQVGGVSRSGFARLNADGTLDTAFAPTFSLSSQMALAVQPDGKILVGGGFTTVNGTARNRIARLNGDGTLDTGFDPNANSDVSVILVQGDGKIYVQGAFSSIGGGSRSIHARLNADGTLDTGFTASSTTMGFALQQGDGKIVLVEGLNLYRLNADGSTDTGYAPPSFPDVVLGGTLQADGKLLVAGPFLTPMDRIGRLLPSGAVDTTFVSPSEDLGEYIGDYVNMPWGVSLQGDGRVMIHGDLTYWFRAVGRLLNDEMAEVLHATSGSRVEWLRGRSAPEAEWVTFELSTDGGSTWSGLGQGSRISGGWELTGVSVPGSGLLRARASVAGGGYARSRGLVESVATLDKEILVEGNGVPVLDGHTMASLDNHTLYGDVRVGGGATVVRTFTVRNLGSAALNVSNVSLSGAGAADYAVGGITLPVTVAAGGSQTFTVTFNPSLRGVRNAVVNIASDDADEALYDFALHGKGVDPELVVTYYGSAVELADGSTDDFASAVVSSTGSSGYTQERFQVKNTGDVPLTLTNVTFGGADASQFSLNIWPTTFPQVLGVNESQTFYVYFNPTSVGPKTASLLIPNDDDTEGAYALQLTGLGVEPEIDVLGNGVSIADNDTTPVLTDHTDFGGAVLDGETVVTTFTISNTGTSSIHVSSITIGGAHAGNFTLSGITLPKVVAPSTTQTFEVTFDPSASGLRTATVTISNDDFDEGTYDFAIQGKCVIPGELDPTLALGATGGTTVVNCTAEQPDGKVLVGGTFTTFGLAAHPNLARFNTDNTVDATFNPSTNGAVHCVAVQPDDNKILLGGAFTTVNAVTGRNRLARLNADGTLDSAFVPNINGVVNGVLAQRDGKILIWGEFSTVNTVARTRIARLNADGTLDTTFAATFNNHVRCLALQSDGKIIVGGVFTLVNTVAKNKIARLNSDGTLDTGFTASVSTTSGHTVQSLALLPDGSVVLGGVFTAVNTVARTNLAKVSSTGALDTFQTVGCSGGAVNSLALQTNGAIVVGGAFTQAGVHSSGGSVACPNLARITTSNMVDGAFNTATTITGVVQSVGLMRDGNILIGGSISNVNGTARSRLARLHNGAGVESISLTPLGTTVTWERAGCGPEVTSVEIEFASSSFDPWGPVGTVTKVSSGWRVSPTTFTLPLHGRIRVRAYARSGKMGGSTVPVEMIEIY